LVCLFLIKRVSAQADNKIDLPNLENLSRWENLSDFFQSIPNLLVGLVSVVFLFVLVWGGYIYLTAAGNEERERLAKRVLLFSVIGLVIVLLAYAVVLFLLQVLGLNLG